MTKQLVPYRVNEKWGYCEYRTKKILIEPQYQYALPFNDKGIAIVKYEDKWGIINTRGLSITNFEFDGIDDCNENIFAFHINDKYGLFDSNGQILVDPIYDYIQSFCNGYAAVKNNSKYGIIDFTGKVIVDLIYDDISHKLFVDDVCSVKIDGKYGCINKQGVIVIPCTYDDWVVFHPPYNIAAVKITDRSEFNKALGKDFDVTQFVSEDNITLNDGTVINFDEYYRLDKKSIKYKFINTKNEFVSDMVFEDAYSFYCDVTSVKINGKYALIDLSFNLITEPKFIWIERFSEGLAPATIDGKLYGFIDESGNIVIDFEFDSIKNGFYHGIAKVVKNVNGEEICYFIDRRGATFQFGVALLENEYVIETLVDNILENNPWEVNIASCYFSWGDKIYFYKLGRDKTEGCNINFKFSKPMLYELEPWIGEIALFTDFGEKYKLNGSEIVPFGYIDKLGNEYWEGLPL